MGECRCRPQDGRRQREPHPFHVRTVSLQGMKLMLEGGPTARLDNCGSRKSEALIWINRAAWCTTGVKLTQRAPISRADFERTDVGLECQRHLRRRMTTACRQDRDRGGR